MRYARIMNGDAIRFVFSDNEHFDAVVVSVPQTTDQYWIVEEKHRIVYVNPCHPKLSFIVKLEEEEEEQDET